MPNLLSGLLATTVVALTVSGLTSCHDAASDPVSSSSSALVASPMTGATLLATSSYDYSPSYMVDQFDGNKHKVWWCGRGRDGYDVVLYAERAGYDQPWSSPEPVLKHTMNADDEARFGSNPSFEGNHLCDPSVTRGQFTVAGATFSYALYYTVDSPTREVADNRIGVAFSNDGVHWTRHPLPVVESITEDNPAYGAGQQVAFSADGGSAVHMIHTEVAPSGGVIYNYRFASDGIHFSAPRPLSAEGFGLVSWRNPAVAAAPRDHHLYVAKVDDVHAELFAKSVAIYRIPFDEMLTGRWERVVTSGAIRPVEVEPGFLTDAWGSLDASQRDITTLFACSGDASPYTWDLCYGNAAVP